MKITDGHIIYGIITPILFFFLGWALLSFVIPDAFAEPTFEEPIISVFDWLDDIFDDSIANSGFDNSTQTNLHDTLDAGIDAGKTGTSMWFKIHSFLVALIFAGAYEAGFDDSVKNLIVWVAMFAVFGMILGMTKKLVKENAKVGAIVIGTLMIMGILGIVIEF